MAVDPNSQLAIVPDNKTEQDLIDEQIDERILNILGLQDVFDIDYGTYVSLLRERVAAARMTDTQMSTEESELVTDEFKRVRGKTGRFKIKKKKVNIENVVGVKPKKESTQLDPKKLLPGTAESPEKKVEDIAKEENDDSKELKKFLMGDLFEAVQNINSSLKEILTLMQKQSEVDKKSSEKERIEGQKQKKKRREGELESGADKESKKLLDKVVKPFTSLFDLIKNFLLNVLLGSAAVWLMDVIKNPRKLLIPIQKLINGIFNFFNGFVKWIDSNLIQPIRNFIDAINNGIKGFVNQLNNALKLIPGGPQIDSPQLPNIPEAPTFEAPDIVGEPVDQMKGGGLVQPRINLMRGGGLTISPKITTTNVKQYSSGGRNDGSGPTFNGYVDKSTGTAVSGLGQDTQLTALRKGEFVLVPGAAQELGIDNLMAANKRHGGTNKPRTTTVDNMKVMAAAGGGRIVTSSMGMRNFALSPGMHMGVDISGRVGEKLQAFTDGKVEATGYDGGYGNYVSWIDGRGIGHFYAHMNKSAFVRAGTQVKKGTVLGELGNTGRSSGPHLHWETATNPSDTGRSKSAVLSRFNPLSRYSKEAPFGGSIMPDPSLAASPGAAAPGSPGAEESMEPQMQLFMADIRGAANQKLPPSPPSPKTPTIVPLPIPAAGQGNQPTSGSSSNSSSQISKFSSTDTSNISVVATSSILQVGGN
jgi:murein DD-endopeptidase MepM/ murein hydrolase activator NlpD